MSRAPAAERDIAFDAFVYPAAFMHARMESRHATPGIRPLADGYAGSTMGMSMLRFLGLKLMPMSVTGRLPPIHLSA